MVVEDLLVRPDLFEPRLDLQPHLVDEGTGALFAVDDPLVLQLGEGVTNCGPADTKALGKSRFRRNPTVLEAVVDDLLFDVSLHLIGERWVSGDHQNSD